MNNIRVTERAPKSCLQCTQRHRKCDRKSPCSTCLRRGLGQACTREVVVVKGRLVNEPTMQQLVKANLQLNERLTEANAEIRKLKHQIRLTAPVSLDDNPVIQSIDDGTIEYLSRGLSESISNEVNIDLALTDPTRWPQQDSRKGTHERDRYFCAILERLFFLSNTIDSEKFIQELKHYLSHNRSLDILDEDTSDSTAHYQLRRDRYAWYSILYALLASAFFIHISPSDETTNSYPFTSLDQSHACYIASLECMHRSDFIEHPNIFVIQAFAILEISFQGFGNARLMYCILKDIISCAIRLGLDKTKSVIGKQIWRSLFILDAFEVYGRTSIITTPVELGVINYHFDDDAYQQFLLRLASIKRFCNKKPESSMQDQLLSANHKLLELLHAARQVFKIEDDRHDEENSYWIRRHMFLNTIYSVILDVNKKLSLYLSRAEWLANHRSTCVCYSVMILELFKSSSISLKYHRIWFLLNHVLSSVVFLVIDILMNIELQQNDQRIILVIECLQLVDKLGYDHLQSRGINMINELLARIKCRTPVAEVTFRGINYE
ncbi:hypothetical protein KL925_000771 [Ogataea polymorpha]|nr:hypothetical protein KL925_000771 [Ogataea polymorpha]